MSPPGQTRSQFPRTYVPGVGIGVRVDAGGGGGRGEGGGGRKHFKQSLISPSLGPPVDYFRQ